MEQLQALQEMLQLQIPHEIQQPQVAQGNCECCGCLCAESALKLLRCQHYVCVECHRQYERREKRCEVVGCLDRRYSALSIPTHLFIKNINTIEQFPELRCCSCDEKFKLMDLLRCRCRTPRLLTRHIFDRDVNKLYCQKCLSHYHFGHIIESKEHLQLILIRPILEEYLRIMGDKTHKLLTDLKEFAPPLVARKYTELSNHLNEMSLNVLTLERDIRFDEGIEQLLHKYERIYKEYESHKNRTAYQHVNDRFQHLNIGHFREE